MLKSKRKKQEFYATQKATANDKNLLKNVTILAFFSFLGSRKKENFQYKREVIHESWKFAVSVKISPYIKM